MAIKKLKELLVGLPLKNPSAISSIPGELRIVHLTSDSRQVGPGSLFFAVHGGAHDGHQFIDAAHQAGAAAIIGEAPYSGSAPYVQVADSRFAMGQVAAELHGNPSKSFLLVGITGTSGKTTTSYLVESILQAAGHRVGVIGTVNFRYDGKVFESTHTTPGAIELQELLARMKKEGCTAVVMEVSSHALKQHRVAHCAFDGMIFTNLSPEHLDYHPDMEDYFRSKSILFHEFAAFSVQSGKKPFGAVNQDDEHGRRLISEFSERGVSGFQWAPFGLGLPEVSLSAGVEGIQGRVGEMRIRSPLAGQFNASNILAAVTVCRGMGVAPDLIQQGVSALQMVPGRLERVESTRGIHVFVDYAHKPDALEKVLKSLREIRASHRLITVFGCGGDRDRKKRPLMGKIAVELSDSVVVTSDNPRTENPDSIIREILAGIPKGFSYLVEPDRRKAIRAAIQQAQPGDIVLIAGKGHEDYQIIADPSAPNGTRKIHFDDREVAAEALGEFSVA